MRMLKKIFSVHCKEEVFYIFIDFSELSWAGSFDSLRVFILSAAYLVNSFIFLK